MEIIQFYSNLDELNRAEYELIEPHLGKDYCLNLCAGGLYPGITEETRKKQSEAMKGNKHKLGKKCSEETRKNQSKAKSGSNNPHAKQCYINGKIYGCLKDAWLDICPELTYSGFKGRYKNNYYNL